MRWLVRRRGSVSCWHSRLSGKPDSYVPFVHSNSEVGQKNSYLGLLQLGVGVYSVKSQLTPKGSVSTSRDHSNKKENSGNGAR